MDERTQRDETIERGKGVVDEELTPDEAHLAHRKEGDDAVSERTGEHEEVGREGGRTDHIVLDSGDAVPRHPNG